MMSNIPVIHHVYSSLKGYCTLYMSISDKQMQNRLEEYCRSVAGVLTEGLLFNTFNLDTTYRCFSKVFQAGVDGVGRRRYCIHTILIERSHVEGIPFFSPLTFSLNSFLKENVTLESIGSHSFPELILDPDHYKNKFKSINLEMLDFPGAAGLYKALVATGTGAIYVVIDNMMDIKKIDQLLYIVPDDIKNRLNVFFNIAEFDPDHTGISLSIQPSWEKKKLSVNDQPCINLCNGDELNVKLTDMEELMTVDNLWSVTDQKTRENNLHAIKEFIKRLELSTTSFNKV